MTQLDRSVAPAIRQLEHFSILQPELHRMKNGMPYIPTMRRGTTRSDSEKSF